MIHGAFFLACSKRSLTLLAPTPTNISTKSEPLILKKGTPASPATAFASKVLPQPGGPTKRTPFGTLAPRALYLSVLFRKSTISSNSLLLSLIPATSSKLTLMSLVIILALLFPKDMGPPPPAFLSINIKNANKPTGIIKLEIIFIQKPSLDWALTSTSIS